MSSENNGNLEVFSFPDVEKIEKSVAVSLYTVRTYDKSGGPGFLQRNKGGTVISRPPCPNFQLRSTELDTRAGVSNRQ